MKNGPYSKGRKTKFYFLPVSQPVLVIFTCYLMLHSFRHAHACLQYTSCWCVPHANYCINSPRKMSEECALPINLTPQTTADEQPPRVLKPEGQDAESSADRTAGCQSGMGMVTTMPCPDMPQGQTWFWLSLCPCPSPDPPPRLPHPPTPRQRNHWRQH